MPTKDTLTYQSRLLLRIKGQIRGKPCVHVHMHSRYLLGRELGLEVWKSVLSQASLAVEERLLRRRWTRNWRSNSRVVGGERGASIDYALTLFECEGQYSTLDTGEPVVKLGVEVWLPGAVDDGDCFLRCESGFEPW